MKLQTLSHIWILSLCLSLCSIYIRADYLTEDEQDQLSKTGVTLESVDSSTWRFKSSGIPAHETDDFPTSYSPNQICEQNYQYLIPKNPVALANDGYECLNLGAIAIVSNGVPMYNPYTSKGFNAVAGTCKVTFDNCNGHPDGKNRYHYHQYPKCLYSGTYNASKLYGVALDGFPIYGPYEDNGDEITNTDLDDCHGRTRDGRYEYRITLDFPYVLGCYRGTPGSLESSSQGTCVSTKKRSSETAQGSIASLDAFGINAGLDRASRSVGGANLLSLTLNKRADWDCTVGGENWKDCKCVCPLNCKNPSKIPCSQ